MKFVGVAGTGAEFRLLSVKSFIFLFASYSAQYFNDSIYKKSVKNINY